MTLRIPNYPNWYPFQQALSGLVKIWNETLQELSSRPELSPSIHIGERYSLVCQHPFSVCIAVNCQRSSRHHECAKQKLEDNFHTRYTNREYWANNIGNVCECSFPFSMAIACSYKEKASSIFPWSLEEKAWIRFTRQNTTVANDPQNVRKATYEFFFW